MVDHLLGIYGLSKSDIYRYLEAAQSFVEVSERDIKKVPTLRGKTIINVFFEPSTRTLASFDIAGKRLSADTINVSAGSSSVKKGETLFDTVRTLEAMNPDVIVIRHSDSGAPHFVARCLSRTAVVNAGDGSNEHPTQALLDLLTLKQHFARPRGGNIEGLRVGFVGDVRHSRVARSSTWAHLALGNEVRFIGPTTLVPRDFEDAFGRGKVKIYHNLAEGIEGLDVVVSLRMQLERQDDNFVPNLDEYSREYCLTERLLSRYAPQSVLLHPGPMNRGTEIAGDLADGPRSLIRNQVNNGVAVRMAVLYLLARSSAQSHEESEHGR